MGHFGPVRVATMTSNAQSMTLVSTIISLAHALDLKVIAEGVESQEQAKLLRLLKCGEMQGFLFSKPLPAGEVEEFLRRSQADYGRIGFFQGTSIPGREKS
jgi:EAL domain-containing protein (putative c-di-GMP-specific phosphodiesterase class I)